MPNEVNSVANIMLRQSLTASQVNHRVDQKNPTDMNAACNAFESLFVNYLMKEMRETIPQNELFGGGSAEKIYTSMLDSEVAKHVSGNRGIGLSDMLMQQMLRNTQKK